MNPAAVSLQDVLERTSFAITIPRDKDHPFTPICNEVLQGGYLSAKAQGALSYLLSLPADWDGRTIYKLLMKQFKVCKCTAYKYVHELEDAGHAHRIMFRGHGYDQIQKRHKITEMRFIRENPRERIWIQNALNQPYHVRTKPLTPSGPKPRRHVVRSHRASPTPEWKKDPAAYKMADVIGAQRSRRRTAFFGATPIPTFSDTYKGRNTKKNGLHSSDHSKPLTPFAKGDDFSNECRVGSKTKPRRTRRPDPTAAAARVLSRASQRAAFDAAERSADWADKDKLEDYHFCSRKVDRELIATWGVRDGLHITLKDHEAFLAHPVTGMLQNILGYTHWTSAQLRRWSRAAARSLSATEVIDLYRAFHDDFHPKVVSSEHGNAAGNIRDLLEGGKWVRAKRNPNPMIAQHFGHEFIPYADCLGIARDKLADRPWHPDDLDDLENL